MKMNTIITLPSTQWGYKADKYGNVSSKIRNFKGRKEIKLFPHECCVCFKRIKEGKKLIPYEIYQGRKYAHIYCWYKAIKKKKEIYEEGFKKSKNNFNELTKKYPKELLVEQLKEDEKNKTK